MSMEKVLSDSAKSLSDDRGKVYGSFTAVAKTSQHLKNMLRSSRMSAAQKESIDNICTKLARLVQGDPNDLDGWRDIAGYANLIVEQLAKDK